MDIRCVVTGQNASGKSLIMRDEGVRPVSVALLPGYEFHRVWGSDSVQQLPSEATAPTQPRYFPAEQGFRFGFFTLPPATKTRSERIITPSALEEMQEKLPGMMDALEPDHPGMHTTDTVDFDVVISGEVYLELDDGVEVLLKAGDCVIQNGTRHAWHNRSAEKCVIAVTLVGAQRKP
jgi:mannose-6-phosphate isomerase-like protein (cupin superfamily)